VEKIVTGGIYINLTAVVGLRGAAAKLMIKGEPLKVTLWFSGFLVLVSKEKDHHFYYCVCLCDSCASLL